jgi:microcystin-dependent protein
MTVLPPFNINEGVPEDNSILSQHPFAARAFRDVVESWLLINHNVQGRHDELEQDWQPDTFTGTASVTMFWASTAGLGLPVMRIGTAGIEALTFPPGTLLDFAGTTAPTGYVLVSGQELNRTGDGARVFDGTGTVWGPGNGSTTFNVPDARGRVFAGMDNMGFGAAGRLTGATFAAALGSEVHQLTTAQLAVTTPAGTINSHNHFVSNVDTVGAGFTLSSSTTLAGSRNSGSLPNANYLVSGTATVADRGLSSSVSEVFSGSPFGSGQAHNNVQPVLIVSKIMKL